MANGLRDRPAEGIGPLGSDFPPIPRRPSQRFAFEIKASGDLRSKFFYNKHGLFSS
jgi:hypothetical protein